MEADWWKDMKENDPRPQRYGWAPGDYFCKCRECNRYYQGDKRSWNCADCAYEMPNQMDYQI